MAEPTATSPPAPTDAAPTERPAETLARTGPPSWEEQVEQVFGGTEGMGDGEPAEAQLGSEVAPAAASQPEAAPSAPAADPLVALLQELRADQAAMRAELAALREGRAPAPAGAKPQPPVTPPAPAQPDPAALKARQDRMLRDPHYAQAVGVLGSDVPEHVALNARHLLEGRAYYASRTEDPTEGPKARAALERLDAQLESLRETAALHQHFAAQAKTAQPAAAPTAVPLAQRLTYADRLVEGLRSNAPAIADLAGLTEGEVVRIAAETEGADEGAWFAAFFERAYALAQTRRTQAAPAPAAAPKPTPSAKPAQKPKPGNSVLRNPAPVGQGSTSPTATERLPWPKDRPPTDAELEDRVFSRN
jgi:hypothetical protein